MNELTVEDLLEEITKCDSRYSIEAYSFIREALDYTVNKLNKPRHVSANELLEGIREFALQEFGPLSKRVLFEWGIHSCEDIGNIVFNLVDIGLLGKTKEDRLESFQEGYDFHEALETPFLPEKVI